MTDKLKFGDIIRHHCDNRPCCRPDHLYLGDAMTNARDAWARGRFGKRRLKKRPDDDLDTVFGP